MERLGDLKQKEEVEYEEENHLGLIYLGQCIR